MKSKFPSNWRRYASCIYGLTVGLVGWGQLLAQGQRLAESRGSWPAILAFIVFSLIVKRMGFHVAESVVHSLVGVVDLAALLVFGPVVGGLVAGVSGGSYLLLRALRHKRLSWQELVYFPLFNSGLNALMAVAAAGVYLESGGVFHPSALSWRGLLSFALAATTWFVLDHVGWGLRECLEHGLRGLREFANRIWRYSVSVELLPLPSALVIAIAYATFDPLAFMLLAVAFISVGALLQMLFRSLRALGSRVSELTLLNEYRSSVVGAQPDFEAICRLIREYASKVIDVSAAAVFLLDRAQKPALVACGEHDVDTPERLPTIENALGQLVLKRGEPTRVSDFRREAALYEPFDSGREIRSGLYVPLNANDETIGVLVLESTEPRHFTEDAQRVLSVIAAHGADAIERARLYNREQLRAKQMATVGEVSLKVASIMELEELFADVVNLVRESFGYYHVGIYTLDPDSEELRFRASTGSGGGSFRVGRGQGIIGSAASTGDLILANDVASEPRYRFVDTLPETRSELAVPLMVEDRVVGVLSIQSDHLDAFHDDDLLMMRTLGAQVAIAIEDARIYAERQEQAWVATALLQVAETLGNLTTPDEVMASIVRFTPILVGVERCLVFFWEHEEERFVPSESYGLTAEEQAKFSAGLVDGDQAPLLNRVRRSGESVQVRVPSEEDADTQDLLPWSVMGMMVALPLRSRGVVGGVLLVQNQDPNADLSPAMMSILTGIAGQAGMALESARAYESRREEAWLSTALLQVASAVGSSTDLDEILGKVASLTTMLAGADRCAILLVDQDTGEFVPAQVYGGSSEDTREYVAMRFFSGDLPVLSELQEQRGPVVVEYEGGRVPVPLSAPSGNGCPTLAGLPLMVRGQLVGAMLVDCVSLGCGISDRRLSVLAGIANQVSMAIENAGLQAEALERERFAQELGLARQIQMSFLPKACPRIPGWQVCSDWRSAREVGGDFYDFIWIDSQHLGLVIADVTDKGVPAALFMALSKTVVRAAATEGRSPAQTLSRANDLLLADNTSDMFVTLFYGILELTSGVFRYARAGHTRPFVYSAADGGVVALDAGGTVLGIAEGVSFEEREIILEDGDVLVMYTDGVTEASGPGGEEYGEERLMAAVASLGRSPVESVIEGIEDDVNRFSGGAPQSDDVTLVVIKRGE